MPAVRVVAPRRRVRAVAANGSLGVEAPEGGAGEVAQPPVVVVTAVRVVVVVAVVCVLGEEAFAGVAPVLPRAVAVVPLVACAALVVVAAVPTRAAVSARVPTCLTRLPGARYGAVEPDGARPCWALSSARTVRASCPVRLSRAACPSWLSRAPRLGAPWSSSRPSERSGHPCGGRAGYDEHVLLGVPSTRP
jgi:hypothetical protein